MSDLRAYHDLEALYASLPSIRCKGECHTSCGPIALSEVEARRIERKIGGRIPRPLGVDCPLLRAGRCSVYAVRPAICRLWGVCEDMRCMYGCEADWYLTREGGNAVLQRAAEIGGETVWIGDFEEIARMVGMPDA